MSAAAWLLVVAGAVPIYAYLGYPVLLWLVARVRPDRERPASGPDWPMVSITVPVYNEAGQIRRKLESVLEYDYPRDRLQVLVVSDASTDQTDEIVRGYAARGVELLTLPERRGKTAAENAAVPHLRGEIVVNSDASVSEPPGALKCLITWFRDPSVGVVSGRDISVSSIQDQNQGESNYVGYEMWVRRYETRLDGIIGASGCFYAIRKHLQEELIPEALSRDFAAPLVARERGFRSISADDAVVHVPRTRSLRNEYRRKVRTMARGIETLMYKRQLLNPFRFGVFAWMLWSHKLARWFVPWALVLGLVPAVMLAPGHTMAAVAVGAAAVGCALGAIGWMIPSAAERWRLLSVPAYILAGLVASLHAWVKAVAGERNPVWEPTRRDAVIT